MLHTSRRGKRGGEEGKKDRGELKANEECGQETS